MNSLNIKLDHDLFFNQYNPEITYPPAPKIKKLTPMERTWTKVCAFFRNCWNEICFWKTDTKFKLTPEMVKIIKQAKDDRKYFIASHPKKTLIQKKKSILPLKQPRQLQYPKEPTLLNFCKFLDSFTEILVLECVNDEIIIPKVPVWKGEIIDQLDQVKKWVDIIVNVKQAFNPLLKIFGIRENPNHPIL